MLLSALLLLLLLSGTQANDFFGTVMTYYPKQTDANGFLTVSIRYKLSFRSCVDSNRWFCKLNCQILNDTSAVVDFEAGGDWCQREGVMTAAIYPAYSSYLPYSSSFELNGGNWSSNIQNGVFSWRAVTFLQSKIRSDTKKANISPQSTILPALRVPSNCQRDFNLLAFDPDGDNVKCRFGNDTLLECDPCAPPSVLKLTSSCTLSFNTTNSTNEGPYAVQLVMEDFPLTDITLTHIYEYTQVKTSSMAISKIPFQFVLYVDPAAPSCTEGLFLPVFLPPTPENRAQFSVRWNQELDIRISSEAENARISELLFSGPAGVVKSSLGSGNFSLRWTPTVREEGESHPICFVVQAVLNADRYQSELRCVIVIVESFVVARVNMKILSSLAPGGNVNDVVLQQIKDQLVRLGLPTNTSLLVLKNKGLLFNATATPGV